MSIYTNIKRSLKLILGKYTGHFTYFNAKVFFPHDSLIFKIACKDGIYDREVFDFIFSFLKDEGLFIDVGTNIGLLSIPVLANYKNTDVISFEPSSSVYPFLKKTQSGSAFQDRWKIINKAIGKSDGNIKFKRNLKKDSAFDSIATLNEANPEDYIYDVVELVRLDQYLNIPADRYSSIVLKIDVEGFELDVLHGAKCFIEVHKPYIVFEMVKDFMHGYNICGKDFISFAKDVNYEMYALNTLNRITNIHELNLSFPKNLNFVLLPK